MGQPYCFLFWSVICMTLWLCKDNVNGLTYEESARKELFRYSHENMELTSKQQTVFVAILIRNKEHCLSYFFKSIEDLDYDKKRMTIWIASDHNKDDSSNLIRQWVKGVKHLYHRVEVEIDESETKYAEQEGDLHWTTNRHTQVLQLRQKALNKANEYWADYIMYIDADNILMNPYTLRILMDRQKTVVAPMLDSTSVYSNFWCGMDENGYYVRTDDYMPIKKREVNGTFSIPMVHSTYLIDLTRVESKLIQYWPIKKDYNLAVDDIIVFSINLQNAGIEMFIDNTNFYGYFPIPLFSNTETLESDQEAFKFMVMEAFTEPPVGVGIYLKTSDYIKPKPTEKTTLGMDKIYMINLVRRQDRRIRMKKALNLLGIDFTIFNAIDSKSLNTSYLLSMGIDMMPGYVDPHRERALTRGEIGCFLSHYFIWNEIVDKQYEQVLILEDDIRFENGFIGRFESVMADVNRLKPNWDLVYVGRKRMQIKKPEKYVSDLLVEADYSYWTLGYAISYAGAKKLINGEPLNKMVPVDEYLPIMFEKHPVEEYKTYFPTRGMNAYSAEPLIIFPTHYTGQVNYFSDTETSSIWEEVKSKAGTHAEYEQKLRASKNEEL